MISMIGRIYDEFTEVSGKQNRLKLRRKRAGLCLSCGALKDEESRDKKNCKSCREVINLKQRKFL